MGNDLGEKIARRLLEQDFDRWAPILMSDGSAAQRTWSCEDGWLVVYTTERVTGASGQGKFVTMLYRPEGKGARTGKAQAWHRIYARAFATRKAAKARATALYAQHSPKWAGRIAKAVATPLPLVES